MMPTKSGKPNFESTTNLRWIIMMRSDNEEEGSSSSNGGSSNEHGPGQDHVGEQRGRVRNIRSTAFRHIPSSSFRFRTLPASNCSEGMVAGTRCSSPAMSRLHDILTDVLAMLDENDFDFEVPDDDEQSDQRWWKIKTPNSFTSNLFYTSKYVASPRLLPTSKTIAPDLLSQPSPLYWLNYIVNNLLAKHVAFIFFILLASMLFLVSWLQARSYMRLSRSLR